MELKSIEKRLKMKIGYEVESTCRQHRFENQET